MDAIYKLPYSIANSFARRGQKTFGHFQVLMVIRHYAEVPKGMGGAYHLVDMEEIADITNRSKSAIWRSVQKLVAWGYMTPTHTKNVYHLTGRKHYVTSGRDTQTEIMDHVLLDRKAFKAFVLAFLMGENLRRQEYAFRAKCLKSGRLGDSSINRDFWQGILSYRSLSEIWHCSSAQAQVNVEDLVARGWLKKQQRFYYVRRSHDDAIIEFLQGEEPHGHVSLVAGGYKVTLPNVYQLSRLYVPAFRRVR